MILFTRLVVSAVLRQKVETSLKTGFGHKYFVVLRVLPVAAG